MNIHYGNLTLSGKVKVKGIALDLPRIERLHLGGLPIHRQLRKTLSLLGPMVNILEMMSAEGISIDSQGNVRFVASGS